MRLATWNLLHGRSLSDGQVVASRLADGARQLAADVVGLQEVDRGQPRSGHRDLTAEVAAALQGQGRFLPALVGTPGGDWQPARDAEGTDDPADQVGACYGIGLVSRLPVRRWHSLRLGAAPVRSPVLLPGSRQVLWLRDEPRVALAAELDGPHGPMTVATTHLSFVPGWNGVQLRHVTTWLRGLPGPTVLLGDLNMPGPLPRLLTGWRAAVRTPTYPAPRPRVQLDHVLLRGDLPPVRAWGAQELPVSDHAALWVDLER